MMLAPITRTLAAAGLALVTVAGVVGTTATTSAARPARPAAVTFPVATTTRLVSSRPTANYGASGALTATVRSAVTGAGVPTGTVDFLVDGGWYWTATLDATGKAKLKLADLYPAYLPGTYQITAQYSGDATHDPSTSVAVAQTLVGISEPPVTVLTPNAKGLPAFSVRSFRLQSTNPVGCNVTITNSTPDPVALAYGTPGNWKRLPFGSIAPGASKGVGVGIAPYTGYFTTMANTASYVAIHCV